MPWWITPLAIMPLLPLTALPAAAPAPGQQRAAAAARVGGCPGGLPCRRPRRPDHPVPRPCCPPQATSLSAQTYRKAVATARRDKKAQNGPKGLTEEQKQEIRCVAVVARCSGWWEGALAVVMRLLHRALMHARGKVPESLPHRPHSACREAFDLFDTDGSGTIDAKELKGEGFGCWLGTLL